MASRGFDRHTVFLVSAIAVALLVLSLFTGVVQSAGAVSPKTVVASKNSGIKKIAGKNLGKRITLNQAKKRIGKPKSVSKSCKANYGGGLGLLFASFGGGSKCGKFALQSGKIIGKRWKVYVGGKKFRVGQSKNRIPSGARRVPGFGRQIASMPFIGSRTGSVFARVKGKKISGFSLFFGGAGD